LTLWNAVHIIKIAGDLMKKLFLLCALSSCLFSCSLLQRRGGGPEEETEAASAPAGSEDDSAGPLFTPGGQEVAPSTGGVAANESEVSRLNTKVAALETKLDVLSANLERVQAQKAQPVIEAEPAKPQAHLAAPVTENAEVQDEAPARVSAAPTKPSHYPITPKSFESEGAVKSGSTTAAEKEFKAAMALFQNGQNLDASSRFALVAKKFPHHMLASHALYWAGEAAARAQQWSLSIDDWSELETRYPRSAYMPEAMAGLARAYDASGDATKGKYYRSVLMRAFPKSPVAMKSESTEAPVARDVSRRESAPIAAAPSSVTDDPAPSFEEESGESSGVAPSAPETVSQ
jgi:TolA-binding protein